MARSYLDVIERCKQVGNRITAVYRDWHVTKPLTTVSGNARGPNFLDLYRNTQHSVVQVRGRCFACRGCMTMSGTTEAAKHRWLRQPCDLGARHHGSPHPSHGCTVSVWGVWCQTCGKGGGQRGKYLEAPCKGQNRRRVRKLVEQIRRWSAEDFDLV